MPSWTDERFGSMIRVALWLEQVVGVGNVFTKTRLREAFPDVAQIDRRARDLRDHGWKVDTSREDSSLRQEEQRYVQKGAEVWLPGQAKAKPRASLTAAQRSKVLHVDGFLCRSCGIAPGDPYDDDDLVTAQLDIARRLVRMPDGTVETQLVAECNRCRVGGRKHTVDLGSVIRDVELLGPLERKIFMGWVVADQRKLSELERLWGRYRALPADSRAVVRDELGASN